jgi:hypothetical protein
MTTITIALIIPDHLLMGGLPPRPYSPGREYGPSGILGIVLTLGDHSPAELAALR